MKITPVLYLDRIEDSLEFWTRKLGFTQGASVPHADGLGFVILNHEDTEVMLQSWSSLEADAPVLARAAPRAACGSSLFVEVDDIAPFKARFADHEIAMRERVTFYGMREIGVTAPSGHVIILAARESGED
jgi:catechol 2,3-dioxygenase-like lactoylglutathione lyase family enzyme